MKVYEAIAQSLIAEGMTDFFGLMGDGNMWLWGALCRNPSVKPYNARHESRREEQIQEDVIRINAYTMKDLARVLGWVGNFSRLIGAAIRSRARYAAELGISSLSRNKEQSLVRHKAMQRKHLWSLESRVEIQESFPHSPLEKGGTDERAHYTRRGQEVSCRH